MDAWTVEYETLTDMQLDVLKSTLERRTGREYRVRYQGRRIAIATTSAD